MAKPKSKYPDVFWNNTDKKTDSECWEWTRSFDTDGYGLFHFSCVNKPQGCPNRAHQVSLFIHVGEKPTPNHQALHKCNNKSCVNPNHLYWGTHQDNMRDLRDSKVMLGVADKRREYFKSLSEEEFSEWIAKHSTNKIGRQLANVTTAKKYRNE